MTPRPVSQIYRLDDIFKLSSSASPNSNDSHEEDDGKLKVQCRPSKTATSNLESPSGASSELVQALERARSKVDAHAQVYMSSPCESTADVPHLEGLAFNAPPAKEWLQSQGLDDEEEEDVRGDLFAKSLEERGPLPSHAPNLRRGAGRRGEPASPGAPATQAQIMHQDAGSGETQKFSGTSSSSSSYPLPSWLEKLEGTINIAVVGNSGVGKSLLINRLRSLRSFDEGWAPVGINETTMNVAMYAFPKERRVRLWDCPGAGTELFPMDTYIETMGLCYMDSVIIVTACRFTQLEVKLMRELQALNIPFQMVRTKVDQDLANNLADNSVSEEDSLTLIRRDLKEQRGVENAFLVSLRDVEKYDFQKLVDSVFPCLRALPRLGTGWDDAWLLPEVYSPLVKLLQGTWRDDCGSDILVQGKAVHVTHFLGGCASLTLEELPDGSLGWRDNYRLDDEAVANWRQTGRLLWRPLNKVQRALEWKYAE